MFESADDSYFLFDVVVGLEVEILVGMGGFPIYGDFGGSVR